MSFLDRLRECRYLSPSGVEFTLLFDDLERHGGKKIAVHELPFRDTADVQEFGEQAQKYPMDLYLVGADYDLMADAFHSALREKGRGTLKHPRWGDILVLPSTRTQTEHFVDGTRMARFQVEFIEAPDPASLTVTTTTTASLKAAADTVAALISSGAPTIPETAVQNVITQSKATDLVSLATGILKGIGAVTGALERDLARNIASFLAEPTALYNSIITIYRAGSDLETSVKDKIKAYSDIITGAIATFEGLPVEIASLLGLTTAAAQSTASGTMRSRADAMFAYNSLTACADLALSHAQPFVSDPTAFSAVKQLASDARARLLVEAYSLPSERTMTLDGDTTPIQFAKKVYGDPERYPDVIAENALAGDAIMVIPMGTEMRWYE